MCHIHVCDMTHLPRERVHVQTHIHPGKNLLIMAKGPLDFESFFQQQPCVGNREGVHVHTHIHLTHVHTHIHLTHTHTHPLDTSQLTCVTLVQSAAAGGLYNLVTAADRQKLESKGVVEVMRQVPISRNINIRLGIKAEKK